jgi:hypothetical protein
MSRLQLVGHKAEAGWQTPNSPNKALFVEGRRSTIENEQKLLSPCRAMGLHRSLQDLRAWSFTVSRETALLVFAVGFLSLSAALGTQVPALSAITLAQDPVLSEQQMMEQRIADLQREYADRQRELQYNFRSGTVDLGVLEQLLTKFKTAIDQLQGYLSSGDTKGFWDFDQTLYYDYQQPIYDELGRLYAQQSYKDFAQQITHKEDELENMQRQIADLVRSAGSSPIDTMVLQGFIDKYRDALEAVKSKYSAISPTAADLQDALSDLQYELNDLSYISQDFYDAWGQLNDEVHRASALEDAQRIIKDNERFFTDAERELSRHEREGRAVASLRQLLEKAQSIHKDLQQLIGVSPFDSQEFWYRNDDFNDARQNFWDALGELNMERDTAEQRSHAERNVKDKERFLRDKGREIKNFTRGGKDVSQLQSLLKKMESLLEEMKALLAGSAFDPREFWDLNTDFDDLDREFWEITGTWHEEQNRVNQEKESARLLKDLERGLKEAERQCRKAQCEGPVGEALSKAREILEKMRAAAERKDFEEFWWLNNDYNDAMSVVWEELQVVFAEQDLGRWLHDLARELKFKEREIHDLEQEARRGEIDGSRLSELRDLLESMDNVLQRATNDYDNRNFEAARDLLEFEFQDLRWKFDEAVQSIHEERERRFDVGELQRVLRILEEADERIAAALAGGMIGPEDADICRSLAEEGRQVLLEMQELTGGGVEDEWRLEELHRRLAELGEKAEWHCQGVFEDEGGDYEVYTETYVDESYRPIAEGIFKNVPEEFIAEIVQKIIRHSSFFNVLVETLGPRFQKEIAGAIGTFAFVPDEFQGEILAVKERLLAQVQELEALTQRIGELQAVAADKLRKLEEIQERIASYNFIGETGAEIEGELESFSEEVEAGELEPEEIEERIEELEEQMHEAIEEAREEKYEEGVIPFVDTDDDQWFTPYAATAKEEGWIRGTGESDYTEFDPAGLANVAETVKMVAGMLGIIEGVPPTSTIGRKLPTWAQSASATLEAANVGLDGIFGRNEPDDAVSRVQVARLIQQTFGLPAAPASFPDTIHLSAEDQQAIGAVARVGIMRGQDDGTFGIGSLNRAELATILSRVQ